MKVLVVGSGGREHALAWKLSLSPLLEELHAAPGNPGIAALGPCHPIRATDVEGLLGLCREHEIELVVVGPEAPLVAGLADALRRAGVRVFGPSRAAARIEGSKSFAKDVLRAAGVPTAAEMDAPWAPCVIKADGLAAGKGVFVCRTQEEAESGFRQARALGERVVVEELLEGEEASLFVLTDGREAVALAPAQDFKRLEDGDRGISYELNVLSAHRDPRAVAEYASTAALRGLRVIICGAGMSAALPGVVAAYTELPVIGVPLTSSKSAAGGLDAILSIVQMPPGVPVACVSLNGARNAAILAAKILAQGGGYPSGPGRPTLAS